MDRLSWPNWTKYSAIGLVSAAFLAGAIALIADVGGENKRDVPPKAIAQVIQDKANSRDGILPPSVPPTDSSNTTSVGELWLRTFNKAIELYKSGMYNDAIKILVDVQINAGPGQLNERATLYHGMSLLERGLKSNSADDLHLARTKLSEIITKNGDLPNKYRDEFTTFLLTMARLERRFKSFNEDIVPHLENLLIYHDNETKSRIHAELGFQYIFDCDLNRAMSHFHSSQSNLADLGKIIVYKAWGKMKKAQVLCENSLSSVKGDPLLPDFMCQCVCKMPDHFKPVGIDCGNLPNINCSQASFSCGSSIYGENLSHNPPRPNWVECSSGDCGGEGFHHKWGNGDKKHWKNSHKKQHPACVNCGSKKDAIPHNHHHKAEKRRLYKPAPQKIKPVDVPAELVGGFQIVSGAFTSKDGALEMAREVTNTGVRSIIEYDGDYELWRVISAARYNKIRANQLANMLKNRTIDDAYVRKAK